jgi:acetolactate synthase regulatory subunit
MNPSADFLDTLAHRAVVPLHFVLATVEHRGLDPVRLGTRTINDEKRIILQMSIDKQHALRLARMLTGKYGAVATTRAGGEAAAAALASGESACTSALMSCEEPAPKTKCCFLRIN